MKQDKYLQIGNHTVKVNTVVDKFSGLEVEEYECSGYTIKQHGGAFAAYDWLGRLVSRDCGNSTLEILIKAMDKKGII